MTSDTSDPLDHIWAKPDVEQEQPEAGGKDALDILRLSLRGCFQGDVESDAWIDMAPGELDIRIPREAFASDALVAVALPSLGSQARSTSRMAKREEAVEFDAVVAVPEASAGRQEKKEKGTERRESDKDRDRDKDKDRKRRKTETLEVGSVIDKYRIDGVLGTGGFAVVYRATHLLLRIPVALKLLRMEIIKSKPHVADLLCEEARYMAQINHPNIVRVFDVTRHDNLAYIVMEFIEGKSLAETIRTNAPLDPSIVIRIGIDVCTGLKAALERTVIHRDIKPANILIAEDFTAKIVDLGLAKPQLSAEIPLPKPEPKEGKTHSVSGTPAYMSPEQARTPEQVDFRSDIYSLGITLYHASTGSLPFKAKEHKEYFHLHQYEPVPPPETRVPGYPKALSDVIMRMVEKNADQRPQSYDELIGLLKKALA